MRTSLELEFVPDVSCPWCLIGRRRPELELQRLTRHARAMIGCRRCELQPTLGPAGVDAQARLSRQRRPAPVEITAVCGQLRTRGIGAVTSVGGGRRLIRHAQSRGLFEAALARIATERPVIGAA